MKGRVISRGKGDRPYPDLVRRIWEGCSKNNLREEEEEEEDDEEEEEPCAPSHARSRSLTLAHAHLSLCVLKGSCCI